MNPSNSKIKSILESLKPLKKRARKENLRFEAKSFIHNVRLTAYELDKANDKGSYIWPPTVWRLVPPLPRCPKCNQVIKSD